MAGLMHLSLLLTLIAFRAAVRFVAFLVTACRAARAGWRQGWTQDQERQRRR